VPCCSAEFACARVLQFEEVCCVAVWYVSCCVRSVWGVCGECVGSVLGVCWECVAMRYVPHEICCVALWYTSCCVGVCCSVLGVRGSVICVTNGAAHTPSSRVACLRVCVCCSVCCNLTHCVAASCSEVRVPVFYNKSCCAYCSVLQCIVARVAVWCSVLGCVLQCGICYVRCGAYPLPQKKMDFRAISYSKSKFVWQECPPL